MLQFQLQLISKTQIGANYSYKRSLTTIQSVLCFNYYSACRDKMYAMSKKMYDLLFFTAHNKGYLYKLVKRFTNQLTK